MTLPKGWTSSAPDLSTSKDRKAGDRGKKKKKRGDSSKNQEINQLMEKNI